MSANQIPHLGLKLDDEWDRRPRPHACPRCTYMGGEGHPLRELLKLTHHEREFEDENPVIPTRRACTYWSARNQEHCGSTHKVKVVGTLGSYCETHDPDAMTAKYKALVELLAPAA